MAEFAVRPIEPGEIDAVAALWAEAGLVRPWNDPLEDARRALAGPASTILVGCVAGRLVATVMVGADGHRAWVYYLAVATDQRRHGFGAAMMAAAEDWAVSRGMPKLQLMVRAENAGVAQFYETIGYELEDRIIMSRRLDGE